MQQLKLTFRDTLFIRLALERLHRAYARRGGFDSAYESGIEDSLRRWREAFPPMTKPLGGWSVISQVPVVQREAE